MEPLLLLVVGAVLHEDGLVAGVGGDHAEQRRRADGVGQHLVHVGVLEEVEAGAAVLLREVGRPQAGLLDPLLDLLAELAAFLAFLFGGVAVAPQAPDPGLVGEDALVDDVGGLPAQLVDVLVERRDRLDVHRHGEDPLGRLTVT